MTAARYLLAVLAARSLQCATARLPWLHTQRKGLDLYARADDALEEREVSRRQLPCRNLVEKAPVKFPKELLLGKPLTNFGMHSGYVNVTEQDYLFYWLVEAHEKVARDAPLVLWSNGGPGCSGMEGATTEHGPYVLHDVKENNMMFTGRLAHNPYSWNTRAHVLYVDQPRYVGFSCGTGPKVASSRDAGKDMVQFLLGWRRLFPEHRHRSIIFASESYGGHYVPAWTAAVMDYNEKASDPIPLKGIALGNAVVDAEVQNLDAFITFQKRHGLIPEEADPKTDEEARDAMQRHLGYAPNYYHYGLADVECCGCYSYNYSTWGEWMSRRDVNEALNVCGEAGKNTFGGCQGGCMAGLDDFDAHDTFDYRGALERALESGIKLTMFYGMMDTACDYVGGYKLAMSLRWPGSRHFREAALVPLHIGGSLAGATQSGAGLTWLQIQSAGHMVAEDNPAAASFAMDTLVLQVALPKETLSEVAESLLEGAPPAGPELPRCLLLALAGCLLAAAASFSGRCQRTSSEDRAEDGYISIGA